MEMVSFLCIPLPKKKIKGLEGSLSGFLSMLHVKGDVFEEGGVGYQL
jgi:hypothetical protein